MARISNQIESGLGFDTSEFTRGIASSIQNLEKFLGAVRKFNAEGVKSFSDITAKINSFSSSLSQLGTTSHFSEKLQEISASYSEVIKKIQGLNVGSAKAVFNSEYLKRYQAEIIEIINQLKQYEQELIRLQQLESRAKMVPGGTPLQKQIQTTFYAGEVFNFDPTRQKLTAMREELQSFVSQLARIGTTKEVVTLTSEFTALGNQIRTTAATVASLRSSIAAGTAPGASEESFQKAIEAQKRLLSGFSLGGEFVTSIDTAKAKIVQLGDSLKTQEFTRLKSETDNLIASTDRYGKSNVETKLKLEDLKKAQGNLEQLIKSGGGNRQLLINQHEILAKRIKDTEKELGKAVYTGRRFGMTLQQLIRWQAEWYLSQGLLFQGLQLFRDGIGKMVEFEQKLANLKAITQSTTLETREMGNAARELGVKSRFSALEIADGMVILGQAGFTARENISAMQAVVALSTSTLSDMKISVDLVTTALRSFELDGSEATRVANTLAAGTNYSKLTMEDLKTAFNYVASAGHQANLSFEQVVAALGVMRDRGIQASTMATGLRGILGVLIAPTDRFKQEIQKIGLTMEQVNPLYNDFGDILKKLRDRGFDVQNAFAGVDKRQAGAIITVIQGAEAFETLTNRITGTNAAFSMTGIQLETVQSAWMLFKNLLIEISLKLGDSILPLLNGLLIPLSLLVGAINKLFEAFNFLSEEITQIIISTGLWIGAIMLLKNTIIPFIVTILGLETAFVGATAAMKNLQAASMWNGWGLLITIIGLVASAIGTFTSKSYKAAKQQMELNSKSATEIRILQELQQEVEKTGERKEDLARITSQLIQLYPQLKGKMDTLKNSAKALTDQIELLTKEQIRNYLATVPTTFKELQSKLGKSMNTRFIFGMTPAKGYIDSLVEARGGYKGIADEIERLQNLQMVSKNWEKETWKGEKASSALERLRTAKTHMDDLLLQKKQLEDVSGIVKGDSFLQNVIQKDLKQVKEITKSWGPIELELKTDNAQKNYEAFNRLIEKTRQDVEVGKKSEYARALEDIEKNIAEQRKREGVTEKQLEEYRKVATEAAKQKYKSEIGRTESAQLEIQRKEISLAKWISDFRYAESRKVMVKELEALKEQGRLEEVEVKQHEIRKIEIEEDAERRIEQIKFKMEDLATRRKGKSSDQIRRESESLNSLILEVERDKNSRLEAEQRQHQERLKQIKQKNLQDDLAFDKYVRSLSAKSADDLMRLEIEASKNRGTIRRLRNMEVEEIEFQTAERIKNIERDRNEDLLRLKEEFERRYQTEDERKQYWYKYEQGSEIVIESSEEMIDTINRVKESQIELATYGQTPFMGFKLGILDAEKSLKNLGDNIRELTSNTITSFADGMTDAVNSFLIGTKSAGEAFHDFAESFLKEVERMIIKLMAFYVVEQLVGIVASVFSPSEGAASATYESAAMSSTSVAGVAGITLPKATGGLLPSIKSFRTFSSGGVTSSPMLALLGDNKSRKELIIPSENISEKKVSGYVRDRDQRDRGDKVIINLFDKMLVPALIAEYPEATLNIVSADIMKRGVSYNVIKSVK